MELDKSLENMIGSVGEKVLGLGVIVFKDGKEIYKKFLGKRNIEKNLPVTKDTRFRVASVSKMFTMFTIMQLVEQNKINLDEDVSEYLNFKLRNPNFPDEKITVRMLASHTSTLRDGTIYSFPPEISIKKFFDNETYFARNNEEIGKYFCYCNLNYGVLGTIIENVTGERFDIYQKNNILKQLDTKADYTVSNFEENEFENLGTLYQKNKTGEWNENFDWIAQIDNYDRKPEKNFISVQNPYSRDTDKMYSLKNYRTGSNATIFSPAGGLRISFAELANCLEMLMNGGIFRGKKIVRADLLTEMFKSQWIYDKEISNGDTCGVMFNYGLGLYKIFGKSPARLCKDYEFDFIGHSGEAYGIISGLYFIPRTKNGVIFMINGEAVEPDKNKKSLGKFSNSYIWEENLMDPICKYIFAN